jgi:hypothetical protein
MSDLMDTPIYLGLGDALAAFGLIFAAYQLRRPQWEVVLRIRPSWQRNLFWIFAGIGLFLILIRVLLSEPSIHGLLFSPATLLFYEVAAYLFFIASPLSLILLSTRVKGLFREKTSRKFYEIMVQTISRTSDDGVNAALQVVLSNFKSICQAAHRYKENEDAGRSARAILDVVLSDDSVVRNLTTKRLDAIQFIFSVVEKCKISRRESSIGIPKIVQNLFYDKESFFYKHLDKEGLALSSNIYSRIFSSPEILTNFDLFGYPTLEFSMRKGVGAVGVSVFIETLSRAITTYLKTGDIPPRHINNGLSHLSEIFDDLCIRISAEEKRGVDTKYSLKDEWWALHLIANFLSHDYPFLAYQEAISQAVTDREKTASEPSFYSDSTINAGIAAVLYKAFEQLSYIDNTHDTYHTVVELLHGLLYEKERKEGYGGPFEKRMWEQIGTNVIKRYYPAALRPYLNFVGLCLASDSTREREWIVNQMERMRRLLYVDLKPLLDTNSEMANKEKMKDALLPKSMDYRDGKFTYKFGFGKGEERESSPPPDGAKSALEGVDLEHPSVF